MAAVSPRPATSNPALRTVTLWAGALLLVTATAVNLVVTIQESMRGHVALDYRYPFLAGRIGMASGWDRIYDFSQQRQMWTSHWHDAFKPFINPPPVAWVGAPMAILPWPLAAATWTVGGCALVLLAVLLAAPRDWRRQLCFALVAVAFTPIVGAVRDGQMVLLVAVGVILGMRLLESDHKVLAGVAFALIGVKPHLALMVPLALALARQWRTLAVLMGTGTVLLGVSVASVGSAGIHDYLGLLQWATSFDVQRQRSPMWLAGPGGVAIIETLTVLAVTGALILLRRRGLRVLLAVACVGSLLVSPYTNVGDLTLVVLPAWLLYSGRWSAAAVVAVVLVAAVEGLELWPRSVPLAEFLALGALVVAEARREPAARWGAEILGRIARQGRGTGRSDYGEGLG